MASIGDIIRSVRKKIIERKSKLVIADAKRHRDEVKQQVFNAIRNHPVSKELRSHKNPSSFLGGKRGTLFGYLGFDAGADPVQDLINFLDKKWNIEPKLEKTTEGFRVTIALRVPRRREMVSAGLVLPWQKSLAWPYFIQEPISNLPYYLYIAGKGRSSEGLQIKNTSFETDFNGVSYIDQIFNETKKIRYQRKFKL